MPPADLLDLARQAIKAAAVHAAVPAGLPAPAARPELENPGVDRAGTVGRKPRENIASRCPRRCLTGSPDGQRWGQARAAAVHAAVPAGQRPALPPMAEEALAVICAVLAHEKARRPGKPPGDWWTDGEGRLLVTTEDGTLLEVFVEHTEALLLHQRHALPDRLAAVLETDHRHRARSTLKGETA